LVVYIILLGLHGHPNMKWVIQVWPRVNGRRIFANMFKNDPLLDYTISYHFTL